MAFPDTSGATDPLNMPFVRHHIERGDTATDAGGAPIGTIVQLVLDRASGQPSAIVIHSDASNSEFELPWSHIASTSGGQVRLAVNSQDITSVARPYNPDQYVPVETGEAVPPTQAGKIAQDEGRPVVTAIQHDAIELVEPPLPTDEVTRPYPSVSASNLKRTAPLMSESMSPTQPLGGRRQPVRAEQDELKTEQERETLKPAPNPPPVETSPSTSTEGELVGGKPSTSGVGTSSTVPTPGTERSSEGTGTSEEPPAESLAPSSSATRPDVYVSARPVSNVSSTGVSGVSTLAEPPAPVAPASQFGGKVQQLGASVQQTARQVAQTAQETAQQARQTVAERWNTPLTMGLAAAGLGTGIVIGVIASIRQQRARSIAAKAQMASGGLLQQTQASVQEAALTAQEKAARASYQAKRTAKRTARRARWFRNGLLLGSVLGILFAPEPGAALRTQLAHRVEQWRSKIA